MSPKQQVTISIDSSNTSDSESSSVKTPRVSGTGRRTQLPKIQTSTLKRSDFEKSSNSKEMDQYSSGSASESVQLHINGNVQPQPNVGWDAAHKSNNIIDSHQSPNWGQASLKVPDPKHSRSGQDRDTGTGDGVFVNRQINQAAIEQRLRINQRAKEQRQKKKTPHLPPLQKLEARQNTASNSRGDTVESENASRSDPLAFLEKYMPTTSRQTLTDPIEKSSTLPSNLQISQMEHLSTIDELSSDQDSSTDESSALESLPSPKIIDIPDSQHLIYGPRGYFDLGPPTLSNFLQIITKLTGQDTSARDWKLFLDAYSPKMKLTSYELTRISLTDRFDTAIKSIILLKDVALRIRYENTPADTDFDYHDEKSTIESMESGEYHVLNLGDPDDESNPQFQARSIDFCRAAHTLYPSASAVYVYDENGEHFAVDLDLGVRALGKDAQMELGLTSSIKEGQTLMVEEVSMGQKPKVPRRKEPIEVNQYVPTEDVRSVWRIARAKIGPFVKPWTFKKFLGIATSLLQLKANSYAIRVYPTLGSRPTIFTDDSVDNEAKFQKVLDKWNNTYLYIAKHYYEITIFDSFGNGQPQIWDVSDLSNLVDSFKMAAQDLLGPAFDKVQGQVTATIEPYFNEKVYIPYNPSNKDLENFLNKVDGPGKIWLSLKEKSDKTFEEVEETRLNMSNNEVADKLHALLAQKRKISQRTERQSSQLSAQDRANTRNIAQSLPVKTPLRPIGLSFSTLPTPLRSVPTQSDYISLTQRCQRAEDELLGIDTSCRVCSQSFSGLQTENIQLHYQYHQSKEAVNKCPICHIDLWGQSLAEITNHIRRAHFQLGQLGDRYGISCPEEGCAQDFNDQHEFPSVSSVFDHIKSHRDLVCERHIPGCGANIGGWSEEKLRKHFESHGPRKEDPKFLCRILDCMADLYSLNTEERIKHYRTHRGYPGDARAICDNCNKLTVFQVDRTEINPGSKFLRPLYPAELRNQGTNVGLNTNSSEDVADAELRSSLAIQNTDPNMQANPDLESLRNDMIMPLGSSARLGGGNETDQEMEDRRALILDFRPSEDQLTGNESYDCPICGLIMQNWSTQDMLNHLHHHKVTDEPASVPKGPHCPECGVKFRKDQAKRHAVNCQAPLSSWKNFEQLPIKARKLWGMRKLSNKIHSIQRKEKESAAAARLEENKRQGLNIDAEGVLQHNAVSNSKKRKRPVQEKGMEEDGDNDDKDPNPTSTNPKGRKSTKRKAQDKTFQPPSTRNSVLRDEEDLAADEEGVNEPVDPNADVFIIGGDVNTTRLTRSRLRILDTSRTSTRPQTLHLPVTRTQPKKPQAKKAPAAKRTAKKNTRPKKANAEKNSKKTGRGAKATKAAINGRTTPATTEDDNDEAGANAPAKEQAVSKERLRASFGDSYDVDLGSRWTSPDTQNELAKAIWSNLDESQAVANGVVEITGADSEENGADELVEV